MFKSLNATISNWGRWINRFFNPGSSLPIVFLTVLLIPVAYQIIITREHQTTASKTPFNKARLFFKNYQMDSARYYADQTLEYGKQTDSIYALLGKIALEQQSLNLAVESFQLALEQNSQNAEAYSGLGDAQVRLNRPEAAIINYQKALQYQPRTFGANLGLANAYYTRGMADTTNIESMADLSQSTRLYKQVMQSQEFYNRVDLGEYIRLLDNLSNLQNSPLEQSIYKLEYVQKAAFAKNLQRKWGMQPGMLELTEGQFSLLKNDSTVANQWFQRALEKNPEAAKLIDTIKLDYQALTTWKGETKAVTYEPWFRFNRSRTGQIDGRGIIRPVIKWRTRVGAVGMISPVYDAPRKQIVLVTPQLGGVSLINPDSGQIIYTLKKDGFSNATPAIADGNLWLDAPNYTMYIIPMRQFQRLKSVEESPIQYNYTQKILDSSPMMIGNDNKRILFCTTLGQFRSAGITSGTTRVNNWIWNEGLGEITAPPVVGTEFAFFGSRDGKFYAIKYQNPDRKTFQLPTEWIYDSKNFTTSSACVAKGVVYFGDEQGKIHAVPEKKESNAANQQAIATWQSRGAIKASPAIDDSLVYFCSTDLTIYVFRTYDRRPNARGENDPRGRWEPEKTYLADGAIFSSPCIYGGILYVGTDAGEILALNAADVRQVLWRLIVNGPVKSSPLIVNKTLYIAADDGYLYAIGE